MIYPYRHRRTLAVVGAGPKGLAVAVKSKVLAEFGFPSAYVTLIERHEIAAHWSGDFGYTNGAMILGTSPEKDVVFPIETSVGDARLDQDIQRRLLDFTWMAFLVQQGRYSDWVDRGRPAPCHQGWANYLRWVYEQVAGDISFIHAEVLSLDESGGGWIVECRGAIGTKSIETLAFDEVMVTGPGKLRDEFLQSELSIVPPVFDLESFWAALKSAQFPTMGSLAVIGAGENAASILLALAKYAPSMTIDIISPKGFIATRSENFYENQMYSQPDRNNWKDLEEIHRKDFMARTDLGVFSEHAMKILNEEKRHRIVAGRVIHMTVEASDVSTTITYGGKTFKSSYQQVVIATGFDQASGLLSLLSRVSKKKWELSLGKKITSDLLATKIRADLSLENLSAPLYVPMLAGLNQGPGFANLSCLGRLSDRIILSPLLRENQGGTVNHFKQVEA